jgi:hypothetical protein
MEGEVTVNENKYNPENKPIRFINSEYKTLFTVPDGGYININRENGEILTRQCRYHGETHLDIGNLHFQLYHICQFAEMMEKNGSTYEPCPEPETVRGYMITDRMPAGNKVFVMAHNPDAVQKYVTWQGYADRSRGYDWGHYWDKRSDAWTDCFRRADSERTGIPYDHTKFIKQREKNRDDAR